MTVSCQASTSVRLPNIKFDQPQTKESAIDIKSEDTQNLLVCQFKYNATDKCKKFRSHTLTFIVWEQGFKPLYYRGAGQL